MSGCSRVNCDFGEQCEAKPKLLSALRQYFKYPGYRPGQLETLLPLMHGRDVFARMATGAGKSLCMFLPPLAFGNFACAVVISPLTGLMEQQVSSTMCSHYFIFYVFY